MDRIDSSKIVGVFVCGVLVSRRGEQFSCHQNNGRRKSNCGAPVLFLGIVYMGIRRLAVGVEEKGGHLAVP